MRRQICNQSRTCGKWREKGHINKKNSLSKQKKLKLRINFLSFKSFKLDNINNYPYNEIKYLF